MRRIISKIKPAILWKVAGVKEKAKWIMFITIMLNNGVRSFITIMIIIIIIMVKIKKSF